MVGFPVHFFTYGGLFGMTCYQSFYSGIMAYKALPYQEFSKLQHKIFPGYFLIQSVLSAVLFATSPIQKSSKYSLAITFAGAVINAAIIMPLTHKVVAARDAQMAAEGKGYKDPTASDEMKALNKKFGMLHGISMLANFALIFGLFYYGYRLSSRLQLKH